MQEKESFLEALRELERLAKSRDGRLEAEAVRDYLGQFAITEEQKDAVYEYLRGQGVQVEGWTRGPILPEDREWTEEDLGEEDRPAYREWMQMLEQIPAAEEKERQMLLDAFLESGKYRARIVELYQEWAVRTARAYAGRGILLEDLIQEANIGLMMAVDSLSLREETITEDEYIRAGIEGALRQLLEEEENAKEKDNQILRRMNHIGDGIRILSEELGRKVTLEEITEYLDMPSDEVKDLLKLTGEQFGEDEPAPAREDEKGQRTFGVEDFQIF